MVQLKAIEENSENKNTIIFQFLMVQLKAQYPVFRISYLSFQFLMVQLKGRIEINRDFRI